MKKRLQAILPPVLAAVLGFGGLLLRRWERATGYSDAGLPIPCPARWVLRAFGLAAVAVAVLTAVRQPQRPDYETNFRRGGGVPAMLAGALLALGAILQLPDAKGQTAATVLWLLGVLSGMCLVVIGAAWMQRKPPFAVLHLLPSVFVLALLISRFRHWSMDPVIQDYCYSLFAAITAMLALFHLGGFCFRAGKRRMSLFWCLLGAYCCPVAMVGADVRDVLLLAGLFLFLAQAAVQLLWPEQT